MYARDCVCALASRGSAVVKMTIGQTCAGASASAFSVKSKWWRWGVRGDLKLYNAAPAPLDAPAHYLATVTRKRKESVLKLCEEPMTHAMFGAATSEPTLYLTGCEEEGVLSACLR